MEGRIRLPEKQDLRSRSRSRSASPNSEHDFDIELNETGDSELLDFNFEKSLFQRWHAPWLDRRHLGSTPYSETQSFRTASGAGRRRRPTRSCFLRKLAWIPGLVLTWVILCFLFFPSYSNPPWQYRALRRRVHTSSLYGAANVRNEKIFIAASISDSHGALVSGHWGESVRKLVEILGPDNTFVSIYENDSDEESKLALQRFGHSLPRDSVLETHHLNVSEIPHLHLPDGSEKLKRIAYLAEVRNRALDPLDDQNSPAHHTRWDKLLYLNDVAFNPIDAANLLFSTNFDEATGKSNYRAACAVDFINPFKFYDTYATRDSAGYETGVPVYPFFTSAAGGQSRRDVLNQLDAVGVKSCWGGMVAYEAKWFQPHLYEIDTEYGDLVIPARETPGYAQSDHIESGISASLLPPLRFRAEPDTYWDASECCLINADLSASVVGLASLPDNRFPIHRNEAGIFLNPYIRVAYSPRVLAWLGFTRRLERLYTPFQGIINWIAGKPRFNPRRLREAGETVSDRLWIENTYNGDHEIGRQFSQQSGSFQNVSRRATPGGFCGMRKLSYILDQPDERGKRWKTEKGPFPDGL